MTSLLMTKPRATGLCNKKGTFVVQVTIADANGFTAVADSTMHA
jgi:hypothetical protein